MHYNGGMHAGLHVATDVPKALGTSAVDYGGHSSKTGWSSVQRGCLEGPGLDHGLDEVCPRHATQTQR